MHSTKIDFEPCEQLSFQIRIKIIYKNVKENEPYFSRK